MSVNTTALTKKCHGPCSAGRTLGREVCLFRSMHTMTAAELWSKAGREIEEDCNLQTGTEQSVFSDTKEASHKIS